MTESRASTSRYPPGLVPSLILLGAIVTLALLGLAWSGNWPKVLRVVLAAATYIALLLLLSRARSLRLAAFMGAGAAAGAVSGMARPETTPALIAASAFGAALLIAPLHWWALRTRHGSDPTHGGNPRNGRD